MASSCSRSAAMDCSSLAGFAPSGCSEVKSGTSDRDGLRAYTDPRDHYSRTKGRKQGKARPPVKLQARPHLEGCGNGSRRPIVRAGAQHQDGDKGEKQKAPGSGLFSTPSCPGSIVGAEAFHFRVRDGNGWDRLALATRSLRYAVRNVGGWKLEIGRPSGLYPPTSSLRSDRVGSGGG